MGVCVLTNALFDMCVCVFGVTDRSRIVKKKKDSRDSVRE